MGLKSDVFFGLQVDGPIIGGVPIYVCVCVGGGGRGGVGGLLVAVYCLYFVTGRPSPRRV